MFAAQEPPEEKIETPSIPEALLGDKHFIKLVPDGDGRLEACGDFPLSSLNHGTCVVINLGAHWLRQGPDFDQRQKFMKQVARAHELGAKILLCVQQFTRTQIQKCVGSMTELFLMHDIGDTPLIFMPLTNARAVMETQDDDCISCLVVDGMITVRSLGTNEPYLGPIIECLKKTHPVLGTLLTSWSVQPDGKFDHGHDIPMSELLTHEQTLVIGLNETWLNNAQPQDLNRLNVSVQAMIESGDVRILPVIDFNHDPQILCRAIEVAGIVFRSHGIDETPRVFHMPEGLRHHLLGQRSTMNNIVVLLSGEEIRNTTNTRASPHNFAPAYAILQE